MEYGRRATSWRSVERGGVHAEDLVSAAFDGEVGPGAEGVRVRGERGVGAHRPILPWVQARRRTEAESRGPRAAGGPAAGGE